MLLAQLYGTTTKNIVITYKNYPLNKFCQPHLTDIIKKNKACKLIHDIRLYLTSNKRLHTQKTAFLNALNVYIGE